MFTMNSYSSGDCFVRKSRRGEEELVRCEMFHSYFLYLARARRRIVLVSLF